MELRSAQHSPVITNPYEFKFADVVFVRDEKVPKHMWKMGRIDEVFKGCDEKIRSCAVRLPSKVIIKRPVPLLYFLELS